MLRGKQTRKYERNMYYKLLPSVFLDAKNYFPELEEDIVEKSFKKFITDDNYFKEISMRANFNEESIIKFSNMLMQYSFVFYRIRGSTPFVTSDNPVMLINSITQNATPFANGLSKNTTIVYFPISPCLFLSAFHPEFGFGALNSRDCTLEILDDGKEKAFIDTYNKKQFEQCYNYLYSRSKAVLERIIN